VGAEAPSTSKESCRIHPERQAVERCASCGRTACLSCAVPVRGRVLCVECATREVGVTPPAVSREPRRVVVATHVAAAALFAVGFLVTLAPWDRFGILTTMFSAWRSDPNPWPLIASISLLVGTLASLAALALRTGPMTRYAAGIYAILALVGGSATTAELLGTPSYVVHTPAPYVILAASLVLLGLGIVMVRRRIS
jgi:hypothetical protein